MLNRSKEQQVLAERDLRAAVETHSTPEARVAFLDRYGRGLGGEELFQELLIEELRGILRRNRPIDRPITKDERLSRALFNTSTDNEADATAAEEAVKELLCENDFISIWDIKDDHEFERCCPVSAAIARIKSRDPALAEIIVEAARKLPATFGRDNIHYAIDWHGNSSTFIRHCKSIGLLLQELEVDPRTDTESKNEIYKAFRKEFHFGAFSAADLLELPQVHAMYALDIDKYETYLISIAVRAIESGKLEVLQALKQCDGAVCNFKQVFCKAIEEVLGTERQELRWRIDKYPKYCSLARELDMPESAVPRILARMTARSLENADSVLPDRIAFIESVELPEAEDSDIYFRLRDHAEIGLGKFARKVGYQYAWGPFYSEIQVLGMYYLDPRDVLNADDMIEAICAKPEFIAGIRDNIRLYTDDDARKERLSKGISGPTPETAVKLVEFLASREDPAYLDILKSAELKQAMDDVMERLAISCMPLEQRRECKEIIEQALGTSWDIELREKST